MFAKIVFNCQPLVVVLIFCCNTLALTCTFAHHMRRAEPSTETECIKKDYIIHIMMRISYNHHQRFKSTKIIVKSFCLLPCELFVRMSVSVASQSSQPLPPQMRRAFIFSMHCQNEPNLVVRGFI